MSSDVPPPSEEPNPAAPLGEIPFEEAEVDAEDADSAEPAADWYAVRNVDKVASPALLVYWEPFERNLETMLTVAGGVERLRPHVKTHKMRDVLLAQAVYGIHQFKVATLAEAETVAKALPADILVAYPQVGPNLPMYFEMVERYSDHQFSTIIDSEETLRLLERAARRAGKLARVYLDLDVGMHRTGIAPGPAAFDLYRRALELPNIRVEGLHVYDGHIRDRDPQVRAERVAEAMEAVLELRDNLRSVDAPVPDMVCGGSPTFAIHAAFPDRTLSPGTTAFWDDSYAELFPDLPFRPAAVLLTRVLGKPGPGRVTLDLGYKAVSADPVGERMRFLNLPDAKTVMHSEEHLVIETSAAADLEVGQPLYALPRHVCPTVALYKEAIYVEDGRARRVWAVSARDRKRVFPER